MSQKSLAPFRLSPQRCITDRLDVRARFAAAFPLPHRLVPS
ncbi:MAG: hypothetical protein OZSIB_0507 [Candidatus Ozemobacter sibiricus]|uniref:Uncharacterized protein n=1 Tax=Candidatus Ozemobacter sibiricus TaxID=2268124 RepID=A0A367ZLH9_9BACT|nr:MAG: hypothetical protein OZSIB_0507 [Candidatus Ozemobacter sibiricus]